MSFSGQSSSETLTVDATNVPKLRLQPYLDLGFQNTLTQIPQQEENLTLRSRPKPSSTRTSQDTLVETVPQRKPKKEKKAQKAGTQQPIQVKEKLSEQIARTFADQLAKGTKYINPSDVLQSKLQPQKSTPIKQNITSVLSISIDSASTTEVNQITQSRQSCINSKLKAKYRKPGEVFCLDEVSTYTHLEKLVERYGKVSHMGVVDSSYSMFLNKAKDGALLFKIYDSVAIVSGDPLCEWHRVDDLLSEFAMYRKKLSLDITFLGATAEFAKYAESRKWVTMQFGMEKVLDPMTNPLILETGAGKRTITSSKALLKKGMSLGIYIPKYGSDETIQEEIMEVYEAWCSDRNSKDIIQAYVSVMDPLAMQGVMTYIYCRASDGSMNGFIALRKMAKGYHIDPCVAKPGSPRGITELLIISAMSLLQSAGVDFLSLGFDPSPELGEITGIPRIALRTTRSIHRRSVEHLPVGGKQAFYDKFHPDEALNSAVYVVIPTRGLPKIRHMKAIMHNVNIDISSVLMENIKRSFKSPAVSAEEKDKTVPTTEQDTDTAAVAV